MSTRGSTRCADSPARRRGKSAAPRCSLLIGCGGPQPHTVSPRSATLFVRPRVASLAVEFGTPSRPARAGVCASITSLERLPCRSRGSVSRMSTLIPMPPVSSPPLPARVVQVRRQPGQFAASGEPVLDLSLQSQFGTHVLQICAPFDGKVMSCRRVGDLVQAGEPVMEVTGVGNPTLEIFVAYRQRDAPGHAGRVGEALIRQFGAGEVFKDIDSLRPGQTFAEIIRRRLQEAFVMVLLIGPHWAEDPRLQDPTDLHREEVRTALERGIEILPVRVGGAPIPAPDQLPADIRPILDKHIAEIIDTRWSYDVGLIQAALDAILARSPSRLRFLAQVPSLDSPGGWHWVADKGSES